MNTSTIIACFFLAGSPSAPARAEGAPAARADFERPLILAPEDPAAWPAFREALRAWREEARARLRYDGALYRRPEFAWISSCFSVYFLMLSDERFLDRERGAYRVEAFLEQGRRDFGGFDGVVLWQAYPRIGLDDRNQFDFYRDMPGGLAGLRDAARRFRERGVRVFVAYNPWDAGTRREGKDDAGALADLVSAIEADGIFLDTMDRGAEALRARLDAARPGVALESEGALPLERVYDHHLSWAQWFQDGRAPGALRNKWFERRHMQHQIRRWDPDHSGELQTAWMNGSGILVWENVFGSWVGWSARDRSTLRAMLPIQRRFSKIFSGERWTPLVPTLAPEVYASLWEGEGGLRLWTLANRSERSVEGPLIDIEPIPGQAIYDLARGSKAAGREAPDRLVLEGRIPPRGIGAFASGAPEAFGPDFEAFLEAQEIIDARAETSSEAPPVVAQIRRPEPTRRYRRDELPPGMAAVPGARVRMRTVFRARECGFHGSSDWTPGSGYPDLHRERAIEREVRLRPFAIDRAPVTNAEYARFLRESGYKPKHRENFLAHWRGADEPPPGLEDRPVVFVDLDDARAYARWAGKRLPSEEEWQRAAEGPEGSGEPFVPRDRVGAVWEWTESERSDDRTRFAILRGGSSYRALGSDWYFDGGPKPPEFAAKVILSWPGIDRAATVGFRCAVDMAADEAAADAGAVPEPLVVTRDAALEPGAVLRRGIVVRADHVVLDGRGATLVGPGAAGDPESFSGTGVLLEGVRNVTVRNLRARGFDRGLAATDCEGLSIEDCDFSDNHHNPGFGWGEYDRVGGIIFTRVSRSVVRGSRANRVWNGLDLFESDANLVEANDFSHCSNVCLKLWTSSRNQILSNDLSYGIRISPGEVHARDSTSVLIESGSNDNFFFRNDIAHGGDGIFIRVLNGWVSTGNVFVENDCSFANNNCVESWSPGNTYIRNKANHGSYGFWLGGSDQTVLIGNEAAYNGLPTGHHNAPEAGFGHGGIVIVGGSSSHTLVDGNRCHHNAGGGIVFRGDTAEKPRWRTHHWIVQRNRLEKNRFGLWGYRGDWIVLARNEFRGNERDVAFEDVARVVEIAPPGAPPGQGGGATAGARAPIVVLDAPSHALAGERVAFDASRSRDPAGLGLSFSWDLGGAPAEGPRAERVFPEPGFYRVGLTVSNGALAGLAFRDFIAVNAIGEEVGTEGQAARWGFELQGDADGRGRVTFADDPDALYGRSSLRFRPDPYPGAYATAIFPAARDAGWDLSRKKKATFWLRAENSNIPGFQEPGPVFRLYGKGWEVRLQPSGGRNLLVGQPYSEARWTWMRVAIPLAGDADWSRDVSGEPDLRDAGALSVSLDSWGGDPFTVWLDGLAFEE